MEDIGRKTWYDGSMKKGKDPRGRLRRVFCYSCDFAFLTSRGCQPTASGGVIFMFYIFTDISVNPTTSGGHIFRCTTKDMEERRAKGIAIPLNPLGLMF